jgi:hypothetical protein
MRPEYYLALVACVLVVAAFASRRETMCARPWPLPATHQDSLRKLDNCGARLETLEAQCAGAPIPGATGCWAPSGICGGAPADASAFGTGGKLELDPNPPGCAPWQGPLVEPCGTREQRERRSYRASRATLYSTAEVDPLVTGQLYAHAENMRPVYSQRTTHANTHGLTEFSSSGSPGDVGVDAGPFGMAEYGGATIGGDDGIPEAYAFPSTPIRWYAPQRRDHFGPEGPTAYAHNLFSLTEPDHDPLVN